MVETSIFDYVKEPLKIDKPIRLIELFAGVGSQAKALERLGANFEHYRVCEFDKYAIKSYNAIHGTNFVTSDVTKITADDLCIVDTDKYCYIMTYSFPCQDLSLAGKGKGMAKGDNTRSGLLWEVERLLNECTELPQILLMENVTQVHGKKNKEHFDEWIRFLENKGYSNYWQDLNAKNFGIPQNRNRTFMVSVLGDYTYKFPQEFPLQLRLKDMLEDSVDEKFYINSKQMEKIINWKAQQKPFERVLGRDSITQTLTARGAGENHSGMIVYSPENENTTNMQSQVKEITQKYAARVNGDICSDRSIEPKVIAGIGEKKSNGGTQWYQQDRIYDDNVAISVTTAFNPYYAVAMRGRYNENGEIEQNVEMSDREYANAITTVQKDSLVAEDPLIWDGYNQRIRAERGTVGTITTNCGADLKRNGQGVIENYYVREPDGEKFIIEDFYKNRDERVYEGVAPTIRSERSGLKVAEPLAYDEQNGYIRKDGTVGTLTTDGSSPKHNNRVIEPPCSTRGGQVASTIRATIYKQGERNITENIKNGRGYEGVVEPCLRIRKRTPKECWRLMGFDDADFEKAAAVNSNSQLYKQAGNSIVVDVLYYIFGEML